MKERLLHLLQEKSLTAGKFAEILDVQPSSISHLLSGRNKPNFDFLGKLMDRFPDVNPDWFISGKGEMLRKTRDETEVAEKNVSLPLPAPTNPEEKGTDNELLGLHSQEKPLPSPETGKRIEKIIFFYSDRSFSVYIEEQ